jgi:uncharacterized protein YfkK (UPF0435 family)
MNTLTKNQAEKTAFRIDNIFFQEYFSDEMKIAYINRPEVGSKAYEELRNVYTLQEITEAKHGDQRNDWGYDEMKAIAEELTNDPDDPYDYLTPFNRFFCNFHDDMWELANQD